MGTTQSRIMSRLRVASFSLESWVESESTFLEAAWVMSRIRINIFGSRLSHSWVGIKICGSRLSHELSRNQYFWNPFESWIESESICLEAPWVMSRKNLCPASYSSADGHQQCWCDACYTNTLQVWHWQFGGSKWSWTLPVSKHFLLETQSKSKI